MTKIKHEADYRKARAAAYPSAGELGDAIFHQQNGNPEPMRIYLEKVEAVKKRIPKLTR